jgi:hypothetical protein
MKIREDGFVHFDGDDDSLVKAYQSELGGGALDRAGWTMDQYREAFGLTPISSAVSDTYQGGSGPTYTGGAPISWFGQGDSAGYDTENEPQYASTQTVIAQIAAANGISLEEATQRYYSYIGQPVPAVQPAPAPDAVDLVTGSPTTTPTTTTPVEPTLDQQIQQWFAANPDATGQEVFDVMRASGVSPEQVIGAMGFDPTTAMAEYNAFLNPPAPVSTQPTIEEIAEFINRPGVTPDEVLEEVVNNNVTTEQLAEAAGVEEGNVIQQMDDASIADNTGGLWSLAKSIPGTIANKVKGAADTVFAVIQDLAPFWDKAQVVLDPINGKATIVFGTPPSGAPVVPVTTLPSTQTKVGVTTGVPILDAMINSVLDKPGGVDEETVRATVIDILAKQAGIDPEVLSAAGGAAGLEDIVAQVSAAASAAYEAKNTLTVAVLPKEETITTDTGTDPNTVTIKDQTPLPSTGAGVEQIPVVPDDLTTTGTTTTIPTTTTGTGTTTTTPADDAVDYVTKAEFDAGIGNLAETLGTTEEKLRGAYDILSEQMGEGFENTQAGQDALAELIGVTGNELRAGIDDLSKQLGDVGTQLNSRIDELVAQGNTQAEATNKALDRKSVV